MQKKPSRPPPPAATALWEDFEENRACLRAACPSAALQNQQLAVALSVVLEKAFTDVAFRVDPNAEQNQRIVLERFMAGTARETVAEQFGLAPKRVKALETLFLRGVARHRHTLRYFR